MNEEKRGVVLGCCCHHRMQSTCVSCHQDIPSYGTLPFWSEVFKVMNHRTRYQQLSVLSVISVFEKE